MANIADWIEYSGRPGIDADYQRAINQALATGNNTQLNAKQNTLLSPREFWAASDHYKINKDYRPGWALRSSKMSNVQKTDTVSFSGSDISGVIWFPIFGESSSFEIKTLQTITINTFRDLIPGRTLGRSSANSYARGSRTIAGSMIMVLAEQEPFIQFAPAIETSRSTTSSGDNPIMIDRIPPFWLILNATSEIPQSYNENGTQKSSSNNEYTPHNATTVLRNVHLVSTGTTYSVNDIYTETMYQFVSEDLIPFATKDVDEVLRDLKSRIYSKNRPTANASQKARKAYNKLGGSEKTILDPYYKIETFYPNDFNSPDFNQTANV